MSAVRPFVFLTLFGLAAPAGAQFGPPGTPPPPPRGPGMPGSGSAPGRMGSPQLGPGLPQGFLAGEDVVVPDFRKWLLGLNKRPLPKDLDPEVLKDLMK